MMRSLHALPPFLYGSALAILYLSGLWGVVWAHDTYYLSTLIILFTATLSTLAPIYPTLAWVGSGLALRFGLFGTVVGLVEMISAYSGGGQAQLYILFGGAYVAFHTTLFGLAGSTLLYIQALLLGLRDGEDGR